MIRVRVSVGVRVRVRFRFRVRVRLRVRVRFQVRVRVRVRVMCFLMVRFSKLHLSLDEPLPKIHCMKQCGCIRDLPVGYSQRNAEATFER